MPTQQQDTDAPLIISTTGRFVRVYDDDNEKLVELNNAIKNMTSTSILQLIRDCVHAGLPIIQKRYESMIKESKKG
jgi:hypothetical protein